MLTIFLDEHRVNGPDGTVRPSRMEWALLTKLTSKPGRTFTQAQLLTALETDAMDETLRSTVKHLRRRLRLVGIDGKQSIQAHYDVDDNDQFVFNA